MSIIAMIALAAATPESAITSYNPQSVVSHLQEKGYRAQLGKDGAGDPMITSGAGGSRFTLFFYNCEKNISCEDLQFHASWNTENQDPSLTRINEWNKDKRFARAYLDKDADPHLELDVVFTEGQMSRKAFDEHLEIFVSSLSSFEKHIGWGEETDDETPAAPTAAVAVR